MGKPEVAREAWTDLVGMQARDELHGRRRYPIVLAGKEWVIDCAFPSLARAIDGAAKHARFLALAECLQARGSMIRDPT